MRAKEIARQIADAKKAADSVMSDFLDKTEPEDWELEQAIRRYIALKLQLDEAEVSDNITIMVRISVSKATGIPLEKLKEMDRPGACGSAPAVLAKRVLLFLDVQKKLNVSMPPEKAGSIQTTHDLTEILYPLLKGRDEAA